MEKEISVSVIIPALDEEKNLNKCLNSLLNQNFPSDQLEVILVDNGSSDRTVEIAKSFNIKVLQMPNANVGAVRNYGVDNAKSEILAFLDADCVAPKDWISAGFDLIKRDSSTAYGGGCRLDEDAKWVEKFWLLENASGGTSPKHLIGASIFISRTLFYKSGRFDESVTSGEDSLLSEKIAAQKGKIQINPKLNIIHLGNAKTVLEFIKRQSWHSENYIPKLNKSIFDPVFLITLVFFTTVITLPFALLWRDTYLWIISILTMLLLPLLLTIKRIYRSQVFPTDILSLTKIYTLDIIYLVGRCFGLLKGVYNFNKRKSL